MPQANGWFLFSAAFIGAISAASVFLIEYLMQERRQHRMVQEVAQLNQQLAGMRLELQQLRLQQRDNKSERRPRNKGAKTKSTAIVDVDSSDLEFFDFSDEDELRTSSATVPKDKDFSQVDEYLNSGDATTLKKSIKELQDLLKKYPDSPEVLWRLGKGHSNLSSTAKNSNDKRENIYMGIEYCLQALSLNPDIAEAHKWYAILIGSRGDFQPPKDKIADGFEFKRHIDIAIDLNPHDASLHHLLGRFSYELAGLKWYEKKIAAALFGEPPTSTYEEALSHFMKAEDLSESEWKENKLLIGKCHIACGNIENAVYWLEEASKVDTKNETEEHVDREIRTLLTKYNNQR